MKTATQSPATVPLLSTDDFRRFAVKVICGAQSRDDEDRVKLICAAHRRMMVRAAAKWEPRPSRP